MRRRPAIDGVERLKQLEYQIEEMGGIDLAVSTDLTQVDQITNLVNTTLARFARIDVLGLAELTRQVIPSMKAQRSGFILNMSSHVSRISVPPLTVYASTKDAIEGLLDGLGASDLRVISWH